MESILTSIKNLLGIEEECTHFDSTIIMHINSVFSILIQLGAGPLNGFTIQDKNNLWSEFIQDNNKIELVKTYVYMKVRFMFDPPSSSALIEAMNRQISEFEWRIQASVDFIETAG